MGSVVSDIMGVSARDMLNAIADGEDDPIKLASFARRTMKKRKDDLELALRGYINSYQRLMIKTTLTHIDFLSEQVELLNQEIASRLSSHQEYLERLDSIPGVATRMAEQILAEVGTDVGDFFKFIFTSICYIIAGMLIVGVDVGVPLYLIASVFNM